MFSNMNLHFSIWLLQITSSLCTFQSSYVKRISYTNESIPSINVISQQKTVSGLACGLTCLNQQSCVSYFYNKQTSDCSIHNTLFPASSVDTTVPQLPLKYYHLTGRPVEVPVDGTSGTDGTDGTGGTGGTGSTGGTGGSGGTGDTGGTGGTDGTGGTGGTGVDSANCPSGYKYLKEVSMCIRIIDKKTDYWSAAISCILSADLLAKLDTQAKNDAVSRYISDNFDDDDYEDTGFFIGGQYMSRAWYWLNGEKITSFFWKKQYSESSGNIYLVFMPGSKGKWINVKGNVERSYICEKTFNGQ